MEEVWFVIKEGTGSIDHHILYVRDSGNEAHELARRTAIDLGDGIRIYVARGFTYYRAQDVERVELA